MKATRVVRSVITLVAMGMLLGTTVGAIPLERHRLYSKPDPGCSGGIEGSIAYPGDPIEQVLAIPPDEPRLVYEGTVTGSDRREFRFSGLPMRKYDLVVVYKNRFFEGCQLHRPDNTLTSADVAKIDASIQKCEPFFTAKIIHRLEGTTGRGNVARCICTFVREAKSETMVAGDVGGWRRTFKLVMLKDVGPGWQIVRTRDLYPVTTQPSGARPKHTYSKALSRVRVSDRVKVLDPINLGN
ncbi:MAG: PepSY domain-containing protein [Verrucomicrobia bacterium]|jgi:hypothetical protein|nr:PepSY domain-containing protein [Verrucomicrobiota bacterium]